MTGTHTLYGPLQISQCRWTKVFFGPADSNCMNDKKVYVVLSILDLKRMLKTAKKLSAGDVKEYKKQGLNPDIACSTFYSKVVKGNQIASYELSHSGV